MTTPQQREDAAVLLDAVARCNNGAEAIAVILGAFREQVQIAYAEGREDRDRLRNERQEVEQALAELIDAVDGYIRGTARLSAMIGARDRARHLLERLAT